ncbi:SAM-dependent methyltransferase [Mycobacterium stomatepiae]|uniref:S-adenosyl-L-methionine-dependent methyltransferase n=1 Tax=Mycobacterium stomatepiae TaxID=470076 RepID=A0A7I7Q5X3_9MYCO|nr:SAM-dependent methyltransferase [Mycobacterium stomatepiae]MCV7167648.1 SAM-dependent methyltransferase [Mycobacterium stomatepiae]BBY21770.1 putative S-adenosyl-L-methionine-dependent methyltransferase [Mycobacterium stomatepiae]
MPRTRDDSWDLKTGVGATATMVAAARAVASRQPDPLICDPFAGVLVQAVGLKLFTQLVYGAIEFADLGVDWMPAYFGMRSSSLDDFVRDACRSGIRQAVILASGLDCRAYRLTWPPGMSIYEVDQPRVIEWKRDVLTGLGWPPQQGHHFVGIDLRHDWAEALRQAGFDDAAPTVWVVEGLLIGYLPPEVHDEILDAITALSPSGSQLAGDYVASGRPDALGENLRKIHARCNELDPEIELHGLTFAGQHADPVAYLTERGWTTRSADLAEVFRTAGQTAPTTDGFVELASFTRMLSGLRT